MCRIPHPCSLSSTCRNGGICQPNGKNHTCSCPDGFRGAHCDQFSNPCEENGTAFCNHHGDCGSVAINTSNNGGAPVKTSQPKCFCSIFWTGSRCESRNSIIAECSIEENKHYCLNNGACYMMGDNSFEKKFCLCPPGFNGDRCENNHDASKEILTTLQYLTWQENEITEGPTLDEPFKPFSKLPVVLNASLLHMVLLLINLLAFFVYQIQLMNHVSLLIHRNHLWILQLFFLICNNHCHWEVGEEAPSFWWVIFQIVVTFQLDKISEMSIMSTFMNINL